MGAQGLRFKKKMADRACAVTTEIKPTENYPIRAFRLESAWNQSKVCVNSLKSR